MTNSVEQVASKIRAGYANGDAGAGIRAIASSAADKIEIQHLPTAFPTDGLLDRPAWLASELAVLDLMNGKISDFRQEAVVTVVGDEIHISSTFKGTLKNGAAIAHDIRNVLTVKNGNIVKSVASSVDPGGPSEKLLLSIAMG